MMALIGRTWAGRRRRARNGNAEGRVHNPARSRAVAGNPRSGVGRIRWIRASSRRTERPFRSHSTRFIIRFRPLANRCARLRSGIHMSDVDRPPKVIHVTSSRPSEGKSTIAMSLAISAAASGQKVALVDADLRHPSTSQFFKLEQKKGLVDLLTGAAPLNETMFQTDEIRGYSCRRQELEPTGYPRFRAHEGTYCPAQGEIRLCGDRYAAGRPGCRFRYCGGTGRQNDICRSMGVNGPRYGPNLYAKNRRAKARAVGS